ncbi:putative cyclic nucleotide-gated ion channel 16 [Silene latifolia]|uniref:putative cyclic nucleotide-gated ion channel 16 n=1 Tax=Silene latifolia TaxID=37657 RepID=UPI003D7738F7
MHNINFYATSSKFPHFPSSLYVLRNKRRESKPRWWTQIHNPRSELIVKWNNLFFITCLITLFLDPLYFFVPYSCGEACVKSNIELSITITFFRTIADCLYLMHIFLKFRTAFISHNSKVFGRKELVTDSRAIAIRYLKSTFAIDVAAMLPLPQIMIWFVVPALKTFSTAHTNHTVALMVLVQFIPRLFVMIPLNRKIINSTGIAARNAWSGAVYNMLLFILAGHVIGGIWYLWALQRQHTCWTIECLGERSKYPCNLSFFDERTKKNLAREKWLKGSSVRANCNPRHKGAQFDFGMFADAFTDGVASAGFMQTYFYCLWWGLKSLSSYGQSIDASTNIEETLFSSFICVMGLFLFSHLIGQVQNYLQSIMVRIEEWRIKRRDTEEWMQHRQLPEELRERIRRFEQYKWLATRGVDEESILQSLPLDTRREIQKHLCLGLVRRVPFFAQMDDQLLDAICERLISSLTTKDTYLVREGDPVMEMLFIIRGQLESSTTYGGRSGFYNSIILRQGDFCGEELLTWAILPTSTLNLPSSTRTVKAITEVEAFALRADDLKFVATQFKRLQSKKLQHSFRYYSHQWRTWGACFIQAAWRRHKKKMLAEELARQEEYFYMMQDDEHGDEYYREDDSLLKHREDGVGSSSTSSSVDNSSALSQQPLGATFLASKFAANTKRGVFQKLKIDTSTDLKMPKMFKPEDPDFLSDI